MQKKKKKKKKSNIPEILQMNWSVFLDKQGMSCQRAVELMSVSFISTQPSKKPPSGWLTG